MKYGFLMNLGSGLNGGTLTN